MKKKFKKQRGFTLIELMITVGIIGVLSSIAMTAYKDYMTQAKWGKVVFGMRALKLALESCLVDNGGTLSQCDSLQSERIAANGISQYATESEGGDFEIIELMKDTASIKIKGRAPLAYCILTINPNLPPGTGTIIWNYVMTSGDTTGNISTEKCTTFVRGSKPAG